jgi:hypothetical protein
MDSNTVRTVEEISCLSAICIIIPPYTLAEVRFCVATNKEIQQLLCSCFDRTTLLQKIFSAAFQFGLPRRVARLLASVIRGREAEQQPPQLMHCKITTLVNRGGHYKIITSVNH